MNKSLFWFKKNLRTQDNKLLLNASRTTDCRPIFLMTPQMAENIGAANKVWLHHALKSLQETLNNQLSFFNTDVIETITSIITSNDIKTLFFETSHDPIYDQFDAELVTKCRQLGCNVEIGNDRTLWNLDSVVKSDQTPYKVFTPFYKKGCLNQTPPDQPTHDLPDPSSFSKIENGISIDVLLPLPNLPWAASIIQNWDISETGAQRRWKQFLNNGMSNYKDGRNFPAQDFISKLSPYIHHGQISVQQLFHETLASDQGKHSDHFNSELGWREFSYYLLNHFPHIRTANFQEKFDAFPWNFDDKLYQAWCYGKTGFPIVDAGMRELYQTGYMHNRTRMICGSFLVKNLLIHWSHGEKWFWDCLFDADHASNTASWQWVAGTGADAAPYFRIFNPILQGKKFDTRGDYIRKYVPELSNLPNEFLNEPWEAPELILQAAGISLGTDYPKPIIDYKQSRDLALEAYQKIKTS